MGYAKKGMLICSAILLLGPIFVLLNAQNITDIPPNEVNTRFFSDQLVNQRPALSVVGFRGNDLGEGYSLEQILNRVYDSNSYSDKVLVQKVFNRIVDNAKIDEIEDPGDPSGPNRSLVEDNSRILQHLAFVALTSFILDENGLDPTDPPIDVRALPTPSQTMSDLKSALLTLVNQYGVLAQPSGDEVKRPRSLENIARAIDLYLALENAYGYYNNITDWSTASAPELLSANQKSDLFNLFEDNINSLEADIATNEAPTVQRDEVEPGNAPLKVYSALGLASMSMQQNSSNSFSDFTWLLNKSIGQAGDFANNNERKHYWNYQTDMGKEFWAEGPYYMQYALSSVVPFWHAVRANGHLSKLSHGQDPFNSSWFTDPLIWLSKITMPGGYTPPLDDGNKHEIRTASVLRWQSVYGNSSVGKRFSWIAKQINSTNNGVGLNNNLYLVELAIPRTDQDILPPSSYGNSQPSQTGENGKQQAIIRRANNQYLLLNGESGDAITRGEGHEQGDNMQLLYNVGDLSYLMDSGYDRVETEKGLWNWIKGDTWAKSSWNNYRDHNVTIGFPPFLDVKNGYENSGELDAGGFFGGIQPPDLDGTRVHSNHYSTEELYLRSEGQIDILNGKTSLFTYDREGRKYEFGDYRRRALFIDDGSDSYLIDFNIADTDGGITGNGNWLLHSYHINSQTLKYSPGNDGFALFKNIDQQSNKHLFLYPARVERNAVSEGAVSIFDDIAEEVHRDTKSIKRLDIWAGYGFDPRLSQFHTTVSFIKPLSISDQDLNNKSDYFSDLPTPLFNGPLDELEDRPHQAWYWQQDSNTIDVIVKRSKVDMNEYDQLLDFDINENAIFIPNIRLPAVKDYGFARFEKNNGVWQIDLDYQINLNHRPNTFVYGDGSTLVNKSFPSNADIYIGDNAAVTITGDVTMQNGTTVYLGEDAELKVNASGSIDADGTTFQTVNGSTSASDRWKHIKIVTDYDQYSKFNSFKNCTFKGADKALYNTAYGTLVERSTFSNNHTAVYSTSELIELRGVTIENGTNGIVSRGTGSVKISSVYSTGFDRPSEISGKNIAVRMYDYGSAYVHHTKFSGNNYHGYSSEQGRLYAGKYSQSGSKGYNDFTPANTYDIYNSAVTSSGATWTAQANYNWWGFKSSPSSSRFSGSVDRNFSLTCDPTIEGEYCDPQGSGGGGGGDDEPCIIGTPDCPGPIPKAPNGVNEQTETSSQVQSSGPAPPSNTSPPEWVTARVNGLLSHIAEHPRDPRLYEVLQESYHLLQTYDDNHKLSKQLQFDRQLERWRALYLKSKGVRGNLPDVLPDPARAETGAALLAQPEVLERLGRTAVLLGIDEELRNGNYQKVHKLADGWRPHISNDDDKASLYAAKAISWEQTKEFGQALGAYEALEELQSSGEGASDPDYSLVKAELADSMAARQQKKKKLAEIKSYNTSSEEIPSKFDVKNPYPNPFNPSTVVPFDIPNRSKVKIVAYDMLGQKVAVLTDRFYEPGTYTVTFNARQLASGMYFIRAILGDQQSVQKVTLVK